MRLLAILAVLAVWAAGLRLERYGGGVEAGWRVFERGPGVYLYIGREIVGWRYVDVAECYRVGGVVSLAEWCRYDGMVVVMVGKRGISWVYEAFGRRGYGMIEWREVAHEAKRAF